MWFKQLSIYPISQGKTPDQEALQQALSEAEFSPCQGFDWFSEGFIAQRDFYQKVTYE